MRHCCAQHAHNFVEQVIAGNVLDMHESVGTIGNELWHIKLAVSSVTMLLLFALCITVVLSMDLMFACPQFCRTINNFSII